jgi:hypothetical protein
MLAKFGEYFQRKSFTQTRPVTVEFLGVEREKYRRNEADSSFLELLFAPM